MNVLGCVRWRYAGLGFLLYFALSACFSSSLQAQVTDTDLCSLIAKPSAFKDQTVRIRARIISSVEGAAVFDDSCAQQGVALWIEKDAREHSDFKELNDASLARGKKPVRTVVEATLTGRFLVRSNRCEQRLMWISFAVSLRWPLFESLLLRSFFHQEPIQPKEYFLKEWESRLLLADAKARIAIYGSESVVSSMASFLRGGFVLDSAERMKAFTALCQTMRRDSRPGPGKASDDDVHFLLFG